MPNGAKFVQIDGVQCTLHRSVDGLDYHKSTKMWGFGGVVNSA
jgi:hypothetical protein